jgi:hypothetical protein
VARAFCLRKEVALLIGGGLGRGRGGCGGAAGAGCVSVHATKRLFDMYAEAEHAEPAGGGGGDGGTAPPPWLADDAVRSVYQREAVDGTPSHGR